MHVYSFSNKDALFVYFFLTCCFLAKHIYVQLYYKFCSIDSWFSATRSTLSNLPWDAFWSFIQLSLYSSAKQHNNSLSGGVQEQQLLIFLSLPSRVSTCWYRPQPALDDTYSKIGLQASCGGKSWQYGWRSQNSSEGPAQIINRIN